MITLPAIIALIEAFPKLVGLIERFANWSGSKDLNAWIDQLEGGIDALKNAKTENEKLDAAARLVSSIRKLK